MLHIITICILGEWDTTYNITQKYEYRKQIDTNQINNSYVIETPQSAQFGALPKLQTSASCLSFCIALLVADGSRH